MERLIAIPGILILIGLGYLFSSDRKKVNWRTIGWGVGLQVVFAFLVLKWELGRLILSQAARLVTSFIAFADEGGVFVFGWLAANPDADRYVFAFKVLPIVIFISSFFSCLYYLGIMQVIVGAMARVMTRLMGVSGSESLATAANVFMGQTEAPIIIGPYIPEMTRSELMALMTGGMATVSGAVLGAYIALGINPEYLISASIMAAPAALVMAKLLVPETGVSKTAGSVKLTVERTEVNLIDAAARGAGRGIRLAVNIAAMLIAFIAMIYFLNGLLAWIGSWIGVRQWVGEELSLQLMLGYLLSPVAVVMGVPFEDVTRVGQLIGQKIILNEFVAYVDLVDIRETLQPRSELIATFALCGFANLGSIGIQIGGIGGLAPERRSDLAKLGLRAVLGGCLASFMTASLAGLLA